MGDLACLLLLLALFSLAPGEASHKRARLDEADESNTNDFTKSSEALELSPSGTTKEGESELKPSCDDAAEVVEKPSGQKAVTDGEAARTASILEEDLQLESGFLSFPEKLMSLLEGGEVSESMWWLPDGESFCIAPASFEAILDKHFQGTKFESFTRKLNRWYAETQIYFLRPLMPAF
jgi:HSF-type DNA-binding